MEGVELVIGLQSKQIEDRPSVLNYIIMSLSYCPAFMSLVLLISLIILISLIYLSLPTDMPRRLLRQMAPLVLMFSRHLHPFLHRSSCSGGIK